MESQEITSADTSINKSKVPALFTKAMKKDLFGNINLDIGGGRYDTATEYLYNFKKVNLILDPYNRSDEHNDSVLDIVEETLADTVSLSNVLNVIKEHEVQRSILKIAKMYLKQGGKLLVTVYEGDKSGKGKVTSKGYQQNKTLDQYSKIIGNYFKIIEIKNGLLVAEKES